MVAYAIPLCWLLVFVVWCHEMSMSMYWSLLLARSTWEVEVKWRSERRAFPLNFTLLTDKNYVQWVQPTYHLPVIFHPSTGPSLAMGGTLVVWYFTVQCKLLWFRIANYHLVSSSVSHKHTSTRWSSLTRLTYVLVLYYNLYRSGHFHLVYWFKILYW